MTSFILIPECGCSDVGSESSACDAQTGECACKPGFRGDKCNICPDGTLANVTSCLSGDCDGCMFGGLVVLFNRTCVWYDHLEYS